MSVHEVMLAFNWLYTTLTADASLMAMLPDGANGVYRSYAPPPSTDNPVSTPYIIMAHQGGSDSTTMQGFRVLDDITFQVKAVGPASNTAAVVNAASRLDALIGKPPTSGSVTGGQILACYREQPLFVTEIVAGEAWENIGGLYRIIVEQTS